MINYEIQQLVYLLFFVVDNDRGDDNRAVMVGDALETDITGGKIAGIDTAWVLLDGIHSPEFAMAEADEGKLMSKAESVLESFNQKTGTYAKGKQLRPTVLLKHFSW